VLSDFSVVPLQFASTTTFYSILDFGEFSFVSLKQQLKQQQHKIKRLKKKQLKTVYSLFCQISSDEQIKVTYLCKLSLNIFDMVYT